MIIPGNGIHYKAQGIGNMALLSVPPGEPDKTRVASEAGGGLFFQLSFSSFYSTLIASGEALHQVFPSFLAPPFVCRQSQYVFMISLNREEIRNISQSVMSPEMKRVPSVPVL
jgi:hypothetical protein